MLYLKNGSYEMGFTSCGDEESKFGHKYCLVRFLFDTINCRKIIWKILCIVSILNCFKLRNADFNERFVTKDGILEMSLSISLVYLVSISASVGKYKYELHII